MIRSTSTAVEVSVQQYYTPYHATTAENNLQAFYWRCHYKQLQQLQALLFKAPVVLMRGPSTPLLPLFHTQSLVAGRTWIVDVIVVTRRVLVSYRRTLPGVILDAPEFAPVTTINLLAVAEPTTP